MRATYARIQVLRIIQQQYKTRVSHQNHCIVQNLGDINVNNLNCMYCISLGPDLFSEGEGEEKRKVS